MVEQQSYFVLHLEKCLGSSQDFAILYKFQNHFGVLKFYYNGCRCVSFYLLIFIISFYLLFYLGLISPLAFVDCYFPSDLRKSTAITSSNITYLSHYPPFHPETMVKYTLYYLILFSPLFRRLKNKKSLIFFPFHALVCVSSFNLFFNVF